MPSLHPLLILLFILPALLSCKRESVTLNERRAVCGPETSDRADHIAFLPVLDGLPRPFRPETAKGTLLFEDGQKLSISSFLGKQGCLFGPKKRAWVLVATDVSPNGLIGVTIENRSHESRPGMETAQKSVLSNEELGPYSVRPVSAQIVSNAAHFEMCGHDLQQRDARRWLPVSVGSGGRYPGFKLSSVELDTATRSDLSKRWKASAHPPSPLGCVEVKAEKPQFVSVSTQWGVLAQSLRNEVNTTNLIVLARTAQPELMRECLAPTNSIAESAFQKGKFEAFAFKGIWDPTAMARGRICAGASCSPLSSSVGRSEHLVYGRCLLIAQSAMSAFERSTLLIETRDAAGHLYVSKSNPLRTGHPQRTPLQELASTTVASAQEWKASSLFGIQGCQAEPMAGMGMIYRSPRQPLMIEQRSLFPNTQLKSASVRARMISLVTGAPLSKEHVTVLGTSDASLRLALANVSAETLGVSSESGEDFGLSVSLTVEDVVGQVIEFEPTAACRVVVVTRDRTEIRPTDDRMNVVLEPGQPSFLDLRETVSRVLDAPNVRVSYRMVDHENTLPGKASCLLESGWTPLAPTGLIPAPSLGKWKLHLRACDPIGNVSLATITVIADQALPDFSLSFASSVENPHGFAILRDPVKELLIDLGDISDDVFSFSELLASLQCEASLSIDNFETESISKCEVIEQNEATRRARIRVLLPRLTPNAFLRIDVSVATGRQLEPRAHRRIGARLPSRLDRHWRDIFENFPDQEGPIAMGDAGGGGVFGIGRDGALYRSFSDFAHWQRIIPPSTVKYPGLNGEPGPSRLTRFLSSSPITLVSYDTALVNFGNEQLICKENASCKTIPELLSLDESIIKSCRAKASFLFCLVDRSAIGGHVELVSYDFFDAKTVVLPADSFQRSAKPFHSIIAAHKLGRGTVNLWLRSEDTDQNVVFDTGASTPSLKSLSDFVGSNPLWDEMDSPFVTPVQDFDFAPYFFEKVCDGGVHYFKADGAGTIEKSDCLAGGGRASSRDGDLFASIERESEQNEILFWQWTGQGASKPVIRRIPMPLSKDWSLVVSGKGHFVFEGKDSHPNATVTASVNAHTATVTLLDPSVAAPTFATSREPLADRIGMLEDGTLVLDGWRIPSAAPGARVSLGDTLIPKTGETPNLIFADAFPGVVIRFSSPTSVFIRWTDGELSRVHDSFITCLEETQEGTTPECLASVSLWMQSVPDNRHAHLLAFLAERYRDSGLLTLDETKICGHWRAASCQPLKLSPNAQTQFKRALDRISLNEAEDLARSPSKAFIEADSLWKKGLIPIHNIIGSALAALNLDSRQLYDVFALRGQRGLLGFRSESRWNTGRGCFESFRLDTSTQLISPDSEMWFCVDQGLSDYAPIQMLAEVEEGVVLAFQSSINRSAYYPPESDSNIDRGFYYLYRDGMTRTNIMASSAHCEARVIPFAKNLLAYSMCEPKSGVQLLIRSALEKP